MTTRVAFNLAVHPVLQRAQQNAITPSCARRPTDHAYASKEKDGAAARRILALALILDGADRTSAARTCGMDRQTLRDRVHRYNEEGLGGLRDRHGGGPSAKLSEARRAELAALVETGPDPALHQVVRWRRVDLRDEIKRRFGVELHERSVGKVLASLGYRRLSVRPQHPKSDPAAQEAFKKTLARRSSARCLKPREENRSKYGSRTKRASASTAQNKVLSRAR